MHRISQYIRDITGSIIPLTAVMLPLILGMTGVGVDVSVWMAERRDLQTAADAAAIAAAWEIANDVSEEQANAAASREAENNGYFPDLEGSTIAVVYGEDADGNTTVTVDLTQPTNTYFSYALYRKDVYISTAARSVITIGSDPGSFCMLSLDPDADNAFLINGNVDIEAAGCGIAVNSSGSPALNVNGGAGDLNLGNVQVVGDIDNPELINASSIEEDVDPFEDPYADLDIPEFDECTDDEKGDGPLDEGDVFNVDADGVAVICGGFDLSNNAEFDLNDEYPDLKVLVVDGGDFHTGGGSTLIAEGITIVLTNSDVPCTGPGGKCQGEAGEMDIDGDLQLSAPEADTLPEDWSDFEGVAMYGDRDLEPDKCHSVTGNGVIEVDGTMYFPSNCLDYGGGSGLADGGACSRVIAQTIRLHGNPDIANNCEDSAARNINGDVPNGITVRLIY